MKNKIGLVLVFVTALFLISCGGSKKEVDTTTDSLSTEVVMDSGATDTVINAAGDTQVVVVPPKEIPTVTIYLFHATRRCVTCVAIGDCVHAVVNESFKKESGTNIVKILEIDAEDEKNADLCEKYEAFGTALFITRTFKGQEKITDMTSPAFKLAVNKPDEFKQKLKDQIQNDLK